MIKSRLIRSMSFLLVSIFIFYPMTAGHSQCPQRITQEFKGELLSGISIIEVELAVALVGSALGMCENNPLNDVPCASMLDFQAGNLTLMQDAIAIREKWAGCLEQLWKIRDGITPLPGSFPDPITVGCDYVHRFEIGHVEAQSSLYEFSIGNAIRGQKLTGTIHFCDQIILENTTGQPQVVEFPIHAAGSVFAAESFGQPDKTWGKAKIVVSGTVDGHSVQDSVSVESISVIPEQANLDSTNTYSIQLQPGITTIGVNLVFRVEVEVRATGAGFICGSATAGFDAPGSISIGDLSGPNKSPLPEGLLIYSGVDSTLYADSRLVGAACCLGDSCSVMDRGDCKAAGGTYLGNGSTCGDSTCESSSGPLAVRNGFKSEVLVSGSPFHLLAGMATDCDHSLYFGNVQVLWPYPGRLYRVDLLTRAVEDISGTTVLQDPWAMLIGNGNSQLGRDLIVSDGNAYGNQGRIYKIDKQSHVASVLLVGSPYACGADDPSNSAISPGGIFGDGLYVMDVAGVSPCPPNLFRLNPDLTTTSLIRNDPHWTNDKRPWDVTFGVQNGFEGFAYIPDQGYESQNYSNGMIWKWRPDSGLSAFVPEGVFDRPISIAFPPAGPFGQNMYVIDEGNGTLNEVAPDGSHSLFASGLFPDNLFRDLSFSSDGEHLYVPNRDAIYHIWSTASSRPLLDPNSLTFTSYTLGNLPLPKKVKHRVVSLGCDWQASVDQPWLTVSPTSGYYDSDSIEVSVTTTELPIGLHEATITISSPSNSYSPLTLPVEYLIQPPLSTCRYLPSGSIEPTGDTVSVELRDVEGIGLLAGRRLADAQLFSTDRAATVYQAFTVPSPEDTISPAPRGFSFRFTNCGLKICRDTADLFTLFIDDQQQPLFVDEDSAGCAICDTLTDSKPTVSCPADTIILELAEPGVVKIPVPITGADRVLVAFAKWENDTLSFTADSTGDYTFLPTAFNECGTAQCPIFVRARVGCGYNCGDFNGDCQIDLADVVFLINYIFVPGSPAPLPLENGDIDCDGRIRISDAVYLVNYIFSDGPEPCAGCK